VLQRGTVALHGTTDVLTRSTSVRELYLGGEAAPLETDFTAENTGVTDNAETGDEAHERDRN
jgi:hypothetical protein